LGRRPRGGCTRSACGTTAGLPQSCARNLSAGWVLLSAYCDTAERPGAAEP